MISIGNIFKTNPAEFDEVWVICFAVDEVRSLFVVFDNVFHVPELAPKEDLFKEYRSMVHSDQWNKQAFEDCYVPRFLSNEKNICLVCFCPDDEEQICHRSIVAGILLNMGASVECSDGYRVYHLDV